MKLPLKIPDVIIILISLTIVFLSVYAVFLKPQGSLRVLISGQTDEWTFQIDADETVIVNGPIGDTVVKISGNRAWVESSPCENQTCVAAGLISRHGQWAACLPNNVLLMIRGSAEGEVDAVVR